MQRSAICKAAALPFARVFVINLDSRPARWRSIVEQLTVRAGLPASCIERVPAIDGHCVDMHALYTRGLLSALGLKRVQEPPNKRIWGMDLNPGAVGCALTHIKLWSLITALASHHNHTSRTVKNKEVSEAQGAVYLIVEDDSLFPIDFITSYSSRLRHVPRDWQLLYLSGLDTHNDCPALSVADGVSRVPQLHRTTNCYALNASAAEALLRQCLPLTFQLDTMMTREVKCESELYKGVPYVHTPCSYTLQPPLVVQATRFGSDIQSAHDKDDDEEVRRKEEAARCRAAGWSSIPE